MKATTTLVILCGFAYCAVVPNAVDGSKPLTSITTAPSRTTSPDVPKQVTTTNAEALANWNYFNKKSERAWKKSFYEKSTLEEIDQSGAVQPNTGKKPTRPKASPRGPTKEVSSAETSQSENKQLSKRAWLWNAQGFDSTTWGWERWWYLTSCLNNSSSDFYSGIVSKLVVKDTPLSSDQRFRWYNRTRGWWSTSSSCGSCYLYDGWGDQCHDWIYHSEYGWEWLVDYPNYGWITNSGDHNGHTVRYIWDCLLQQGAWQYQTVVTDIGVKPVQYFIDDLKYYRWYDSNNFAWFAACPTVEQKKLLKRQGIHGRNSNPVWDFGTWDHRNFYSDMTPIPSTLIDDYDPKAVYTAMYFPRTIEWKEIEGEECSIMALSRPGLRHWTARMIDIPPLTYPKIEDEQWYPSWYYGYEKYAKGPLDANEFYWGTGP